MTKNQLYYGDNLDVLRRYVRDESVDLVYLDPPFNSNASYNVLFGNQNGTRSAAQIKAFGDTWEWNTAAAEAYQETVERGGKVSDALQAFKTLLSGSNMLAYLAMMAPRLVELRRVLKPAGSIYLHCDPTASHYLKILMDAVCGPENFRNEIVWKRTAAKGDARRRFGRVHDILLCYGRTPASFFQAIYGPQDAAYKGRFRLDDGDGKGPYRLAPLDSPNPRPNLTYEYEGYQPPAKGWRVRIEVMRQLDEEGRLSFPSKKEGRIARKHYLREQSGPKITDVWTDIAPLQASSAERLGYPTQKPEALLERIVRASSSEDAVVLDPFCGCGTTVAAAQKLGRPWIGIDITHLAINLIRHRLRDTYGPEVEDAYEVIGEPTSLEGAQALAEQDRHQFEWWALGLVGARPEEGKKGADRGIDGRLFFHDEGPKGSTKKVILSVKSGSTGSAHIRDLVGVLDREKAHIGVLITLQEPTKPMRKEVASAGFYFSPWTGRNHPRLQILTVKELLEGARIDMPETQGMNITYKRAPQQLKKVAEQLNLGEGDSDA